LKGLSLIVVIPTYNRKYILEKCLNALFNQTCSKSDYEIIVIDDGSTDGTKEVVASMINSSPCKIRYFEKKHKGPAAARNVGIKNAEGEIILFIGDDIIATPTLLEEHYKWHRQYPDDNVAIVGFVTWSPEIKITPFMKWLENGGPQFHFWQIKDKIEIDEPKYFYTANLSLKRKFLLENNGFFVEDFPYAACEDIELGYRLKKIGMILKFNKNATGYHFHPINLNKYCRRMLYAGSSLVILSNKLPESFSADTPKTSLIKKIVKYPYPIIIKLMSFLDYYLGISFYSWYGKITDYYKYEGIKRAKTNIFERGF